MGTTAETFISDALESVSGFGWRELGDLWRGRGGKREDLARVVRDPANPYRFRREEATQQLYVERRASEVRVKGSAKVPAEVSSMRPENLRKPDTGHRPRALPPKVGGVYRHGSECSCWICEDEAPAERVEVGVSA